MQHMRIVAIKYTFSASVCTYSVSSDNRKHNINLYSKHMLNPISVLHADAKKIKWLQIRQFNDVIAPV